MTQAAVNTFNLNIPKIYMLQHPKDTMQGMIFMHSPEWTFVKVVYQMDEQGTYSSILVKTANGLSLEMYASQAYDLSYEDARAIWAFLTNELNWIQSDRNP